MNTLREYIGYVASSTINASKACYQTLIAPYRVATTLATYRSGGFEETFSPETSGAGIGVVVGAVISAGELQEFVHNPWLLAIPAVTNIASLTLENIVQTKKKPFEMGVIKNPDGTITEIGSENF
jgi:hypothetical protein